MTETIHGVASTDAECAVCEARPGLLSEAGLCNECHIRATSRAEKPASAKPDPYAEHRRRINDTEAAQHMLEHDIASGRHARLVAQLVKERATEKPFAPRFPHEGRSERVYGGRRWVDK